MTFERFLCKKLGACENDARKASGSFFKKEITWRRFKSRWDNASAPNMTWLLAKFPEINSCSMGLGNCSCLLTTLSKAQIRRKFPWEKIRPQLKKLFQTYRATVK